MKVNTKIFGEFDRAVELKDAVYSSIVDDTDRDRMVAALVSILADKGVLTKEELVLFLAQRYEVS